MISNRSQTQTWIPAKVKGFKMHKYTIIILFILQHTCKHIDLKDTDNIDNRNRAESVEEYKQMCTE